MHVGVGVGIEVAAVVGEEKGRGYCACKGGTRAAPATSCEGSGNETRDHMGASFHLQSSRHGI